MLLNTPVCDFGWQAPNFTLPDTNNRLHGLDSLIGANGLLIAFICNHCPYVKAIIDRLVRDAIALQQRGINTVAIMPNDYHSYPEDSPEIWWLSLIIIISPSPTSLMKHNKWPKPMRRYAPLIFLVLTQKASCIIVDG